MGATEILGIDSSQKMIAKAVADNSDDKIKYKVCGVEEYIYPENTYDLVVSNLVLHYIENLANVYQKVYCTLKVGGYFLFNIEHPTFTAGVNEDWIYDENGKPKYWPIDNYYYTGERETNFLGQRVIKQHHTLTQILNPLIKCGFQIEAIEEAMPPADMMGAFRTEYAEKDHCPCQKACRYHGNCKECVAIHRAHQEHVPNCMRPMINAKLRILSELTEHTIANEIEPPKEILRKR